MFKKALYLGSFCALALLASCGNKQNNEEAAAADSLNDTTIVGEVVTEVAQQGDTIVAATAEAIDTLTPAPAASTDTKSAEAPAATKAQ